MMSPCDVSWVYCLALDNQLDCCFLLKVTYSTSGFLCYLGFLYRVAASWIFFVFSSIFF